MSLPVLERGQGVAPSKVFVVQADHACTWLASAHLHICPQSQKEEATHALYKVSSGVIHLVNASYNGCEDKLILTFPVSPDSGQEGLFCTSP